MAARVEVVKSVSQCKQAVERLEREQYIAADAEGVHMSKTGPLTLLQIGSVNGQVYLFDVKQESRRMFNEGGLKRLLESESVVKVMHSGRNDGQALFWQYKVDLKGVFDTQVAQLVLDKAGGRRFPQRQKLADVVSLHCPSKAGGLEQDKDAVRTKWNKTEGEYWAKRPLTAEMIEYASNDVLVLIPEVYTEQKRLLQEKGLMDVFKKTVSEDIESKKDQALSDRLQQEDRDLIKTILIDFFSTAPKSVKLSAITDEDVLVALTHLRYDEMTSMGLPPLVKDLKVQHMRARLEEIEKELLEKGSSGFEPNNSTCFFVRACAFGCDNDSIKAYGIRLQDQIDKIILEDVKRKYTDTTPIEHVADYERRAITAKLRPKGDRDSNVHPVLLRLYWEIKSSDLDRTIQKYQDDRRNFKVTEGFAKLLKFYHSNPDVPADIKRKGKALLSTLTDAGLIARPPRRPRRVEYDYDDDF